MITVIKNLNTISFIGIFPDCDPPTYPHFFMDEPTNGAHRPWHFRLCSKLHDWLEERGIPYELKQNGRHMYGPLANLLVPLEHAVLVKLTWGGRTDD